MDRKKKIRLIVIMPAVFTTVVIGGLLTFVLIGASSKAQETSGVVSSSPAEAAASPAAAPPADAAAPACEFADWVGKPVNEDTVKATGRPYRVLKPGDAATMDFSAARINVETDGQGVVTSVHCG